MALMARLGLASFGLALVLAAVSSPPARADGAPGDPDKGAKVFQSAGCGNCHTLAAANASGSIGPSLDSNANLNTALVVNRVNNGQGGMPSFGGQLSDQDIADVAAYVAKVATK